MPPPASDAPAISVLMPVRDAQPWLGDALESVLAQSEPAFELLAVDDGSSDDSARLLHEHAQRDARVRPLQTRSTARGIVEALNLGLAVARGTRIARMDADDLMHPCRLAMQSAMLDDDPSLFGVTCRTRAFPESEAGDGMREYLAWQNGLATPAQIALERFVECPALHPTWMLRADVLRERLGGWRDAGWAEDWDLMLRAHELGLAIRRVPETLMSWRQHARQACRSDSRYGEESMMRLRAHFLARFLAPIEKGRGLWILGAGPVGKRLVKALAGEGVVADGLVDVDPRKIGGVVRGGGRSWPVIAHTHLGELSPRPFAVSAVAGAAARLRVRAELARIGWTEPDDFVLAA
ncbi:MAG TPA: glycosyltransferase [Candidatus Limnocylindrales bacterium]|nr:glycosyltransferase [Candidatus Limnocylindrales bacterium]